MEETLTSIGTQFRNVTYTYDSRGFIATKSDAMVNQSETYCYDNLDRLESYSVNNVTAASFSFDGNGNIETNSKIGSYNYGSTRPHAVISIDGNERTASPSLCDVTYNLRNRPENLYMNGYNVTLDYDASGMRRHTLVTNGQTFVKEKTRISDFYEEENTPLRTQVLDYIYAEGKVVAVRVGDGHTGSLYYVLTDHLGSWEKVLDEDKTVVQQTHFDPWGNRMSYTAWNTPQTQTTFTFDRGFTGHEHYDFLHVINANARLYDPTIGCFFSPDPFVQDPSSTQNFNRYAYCMNNPLKYTDPDGEWAHLVIGALIGGIANLASGLISGQISTFGEGLAYFGIGSVAGALSAGVGAGVSSLIGGGSFGAGFLGTTAAKTAVTSFASGSVIGASSGLTGGFVTGAGNSWMQGANFAQGLWDGTKAGVKGAFWGAIGGGLGGGIDAALDGRDFLSGDVIIKNSRAYPTGPDYMQQPNSGDCAIKTGKAIYDYDNEIHISSSQIRQDLGLPCRGGVSDVDYWNAFGEQYGYDITQTSTLTENVPSPSTAYGIGSFNDGAHVALSNSQNGTDITHTVLIRETETRLHTTWGKGAHVKMSYRFWVQNPTTGYRDPIPYSSISKAVNMFIIRKQ